MSHMLGVGTEGTAIHRVAEPIEPIAKLDFQLAD